jgi:endoglucanase
MLADRRLADFLAELAREKSINHQVVVKNTGATDAAAGQLVAGGVVVGALSVPTRYIHAPVGMVKKDDISRTVALTTAFLEAAGRFRQTLEIKA